MALDLNIETNSSIYDEEILDSTKKQYFNSDKLFEASRFELLNLPPLLNSNDITTRSKQLIHQYNLILKKVMMLILAQQSKFKDELNKIITIQELLHNILKLCKFCRINLKTASHQYSVSSLLLLYYCRKRKILKNLIKILCRIRTLNHTKDQLQQFLENENYPAVITLLSKCQKTADTHKQYYCVAALDNKLTDILELVEENLDLSISKNCLSFNVNNYASAQSAYKFLGKSQTAIDQLHMHFIATIHNTACCSILKHAEQVNDKQNVVNQYHILCKSVSISNFYPCLVDLCKSFLDILKSYYFVIKWHTDQQTKNMENKSLENIVTINNEQYILEKLRVGLVKICSDVENKIIVYLDGFNLTNLKFEEVMQALNIVDRMLKIGKKLCKTDMVKLHEYSKNNFLNYLNYYQTLRLEELKIFLENDGWELCPIKSTFTITQLREFKSCKNIFNLSKSSGSAEDNMAELDEYYYNFNLLNDYTNNSTESTDEDILRTFEESQSYLSDDTDDEEIPEELKYIYVDEKKKNLIYQKDHNCVGPIATNTSLTALRICGKYLQTTLIFKEFTKTVAQFMIQIYELYFYTVYSFFSTEFVKSDFSASLGTNLKRTISRIKESLIIDEKQTSGFPLKVHQPLLSPAININEPKNLFGLTERIVAVESLIFLTQQYESFRLYFNSIICNDDEKMSLNQFYQQSISLSIAMRKPIYMSAILKAFDISHILFSIGKVDWELKDIVSQHNSYINYLLNEIEICKQKLLTVERKVPLTKEIYESIWESVADIVTHTFVDGFSSIKKCSNEGRALMQLDFTQFVLKFEAITGQRPMPHQEFVTAYIKAYYLPESSIESWIKSHIEYTSKHMIGLVTCMNQNKKFKQRLINLLEDQRQHR